MRPSSQPDDRRVRRTQRALKEAFLSLVTERGYEKVSVEDITERADVARATFYAHYPHKEALLTSVFTELIGELAQTVMTDTAAPEVVYVDRVERAYKHAGELRDLYLVCLSGAADGVARDAFLESIVELSSQTISERVHALGTSPRIPVEVMARAFAGAHVALLRAWLRGHLEYSAEEMALMELQVLNAGIAWAEGIALEDLRFARLDGAGSST